ncbi:MAG: tRNA (N6-isopentenyl adenosine(37)-C2)-methylthiotransferase MiaB [Patescibacteria group bacterium]
MTKKYYIKTLGCQMNHSDSERIAACLESCGFSPLPGADLSAEALAKADLVVFNTCGVRQMAEDRAYGQIHNLRKSSKKVKIVLTGCLANRKDVQRRLKNKVNLFFTINDFKTFENFIIKNSLKIENLKLKITQSNNTPNKESIAYLSIKPKHANKFQAYIPIMTGCNNFCSYCVVPYARGREVSRPAEEIIKEVKNLVKNRYKEIVLLGQNVNSYRFIDKNSSAEASAKEDKVITFSKLLRTINAIPGHFWISFISNHPKDVTDEMIETVAKLPKICECFHLPIQSGNDAIIRKMNRRYTSHQYLTLIKKIKVAFKRYKPQKLFSITSDIIVGFPGETKRNFLASAEMMKRAMYDMVYFGQYSPRPGTVAWKMKDNVSKKEKARREKYLNEILKKTVFTNNKKYIGKTLEVLIDSKKGDFYFGKTRTMKNVKIISNKKGLVGQFVKVKITKANIWNLEGKLGNT